MTKTKVYTIFAVIIAVYVVIMTLVFTYPTKSVIDKLIVKIYELHDDQSLTDTLYASISLKAEAEQKAADTKVVSSYRLQKIIDTCEQLNRAKDSLFMDKNFNDVLAKEVSICAKIGATAKTHTLTYGDMKTYSKQMIEAYQKSKYAELDQTAATTKSQQEYKKLEEKATAMSNWN